MQSGAFLSHGDAAGNLRVFSNRTFILFCKVLSLATNETREEVEHPKFNKNTQKNMTYDLHKTAQFEKNQIIDGIERQRERILQEEADKKKQIQKQEKMLREKFSTGMDELEYGNEAVDGQLLEKVVENQRRGTY